MICPRCSKALKPFDEAGDRGWNCPSCHHYDAETNPKEAEQIQIDIAKAKFLKDGGKIEVVDYTQNRSFKDPIKRTRKDQINTLRNRDLNG